MRYAVVVPQGEFVPTPQNPIDKRAKGYWVNAIQFREVMTNPFAAMVGAAPAPPIPKQQPQPQPQQPTGNIGFPPPPPEDLFAPRGMSAPMPPMYNDNDNLPY